MPLLPISRTLRRPGHGPTQFIDIQLKIAAGDREKLQAHLDHLGISVHTLVRRLIQKELVEETQLYERNKNEHKSECE